MKTALLFGFFISFNAMAVETFTQTCRVIGEDDYVQYQIEAEIPLQSGSQFNLKLTAFEDENCSIPYLHYNQYFFVDFIQAEKLNLKTQKVTYTTLSDQVSDALNMIQYCGLHDWTTKSEKTVTGKTCDDFQQLAFNQILFQIFKQNGNQIYLGQIDHQKDGRNENQRPVNWDQLEFTKILTKPSLNVDH